MLVTTLIGTDTIVIACWVVCANVLVSLSLVDQMYCCDLLLNIDGLTCTVMGYAEGKVSHLSML